MTAVVPQLDKSTSPVLRLVFTMFFLGMHSTIAQSSGNISGKVVDKSSGDELPFANIYLESTSFGTATDENQCYRPERQKTLFSLRKC